MFHMKSCLLIDYLLHYIFQQVNDISSFVKCERIRTYMKVLMKKANTYKNVYTEKI